VHSGLDPKHDSDPGYIVGWKYKYKFESGKYADQVMTYGEAKKRAEDLSAEHPDMTFWAEKAPGSLKSHGV
jgi:hypothetical protein